MIVHIKGFLDFAECPLSDVAAALSQMLGLVILVIHPSDAVARSVGLVGFADLAFVLYAGGRILAAERRFASVVGLVCAAAGATAGGI